MTSLPTNLKHKSSASLIRAVQYVRMSTEHQQYSTLNQEDVIKEYAKNRGFEIVRTYADQGKSGLNVAGRKSLQLLIEDVQKESPGFEVILVYDVSRWGRFQDADESAYYEYLCKRSGISVHYCAEQFENDGGPVSAIIKSVKRAMAGEYSRELSSKVFQGQSRLIELGYRQGGAPGYGLRRMLIDQTGIPKGILKRGEQKSLQTDRVILVPGPEEEVQNVQRIYQLFVNDSKRETEIADILNSEDISTDMGRTWNRSTIQQILTNEKYIGNNVYNRTSFKLKCKHVRNTPNTWIRKDGAFKPIVSHELFFMVREIIQERNHQYSDDELIEKLKVILNYHPRLSAAIIDAAENTPPAATYRTRFGGLIRAFRLAGYIPDRNYEYLEINQNLRQLHPKLVADMTKRLDSVGATVTHDKNTDLLLINGEFSATMVLSRCQQTPAGSLRWLIRLDTQLLPDITILVRMDPENQEPSDYYFFPMMDIDSTKMLLCESNGAYLDTYQFDSLEYFTTLSSRKTIEELL